MKYLCKIILCLLTVITIVSCTAPTYLTPTIQKSYLTNRGTFSIQNMDQIGKIEPQSLTTHYDGFDVKYKVTNNFLIFFEIINNTNRSLIIDKSKCYVLYNGYSTDIFKDVRSSRSTTFNNVQDAINNVQTSDASVTMTIPPYSKWQLPLGESNIRNLSNLPPFIKDLGSHPLQSYDNPEPVEFVIPYTFDYSLAKWNTSRNRVYIAQIDVLNESISAHETPYMLDETHYRFGKVVMNSTSNKNEVDMINEHNIKKWKSHRHMVNASHIFWGTLFCWTIWGPLWAWGNNEGCKIVHKPYIYNSDGSTNGVYDKNINYRAAY